MDLGELTIATRERKSVQSGMEDDLGKLTLATRERWSQETVAVVGNWPLLKTSQLGKDLFRAGIN